jgi:hypothetical protein
MPQLQSSGQIRLTDITGEFGGTAPHRISEYYQGGSAGVGDNNTNVPTTGQIRITNFYSAVNSVTQTLANNSTNVNLSTTFGSDWASSIPKVLVIEAGSTIGGTGGTAAITVPTGMGGTLIIQNAGTIVGTGGAAGSAGGDAIVVNQTSGVTITNTGSIYGGGGGGGAGGNGSYESVGSYYGTGDYPYVWGATNSTIEIYWAGSRVVRALGVSGAPNVTSYGIYRRGTFYKHGVIGAQYSVAQASTVNTTGGSGGVGAGYNQSSGTGVAGGTNAGTGGDGGAYGTAGSTGANGNVTNGAAGGAAGNYVNGISNITLNNTGTVAGGTA